MENHAIELFRLPDDNDRLNEVVDRVLTMNEHEHLVDNDIDMAFLFRADEKVIGGRHILGTVYEPKVQGGLRDFFEWMTKRLLGRIPQFLIILDAEYWAESDARLREILIFHELCHIQQKIDRHGAPRFDMDGNPVYGLRAHDVEEFTATVSRYGAWNEDIVRFIEAAAGGDQ